MKRYRAGAWVCGAAVVSHWVLDLLLHRPDLPILPGGDYRAGFGLWNSLAATLVIELAVFAVGLALYLRTTTAIRSHRCDRPVEPGGLSPADLCRKSLRGSAAKPGLDRHRSSRGATGSIGIGHKEAE